MAEADYCNGLLFRLNEAFARLLAFRLRRSLAILCYHFLPAISAASWPIDTDDYTSIIWFQEMSNNSVIGGQTHVKISEAVRFVADINCHMRLYRMGDLLRVDIDRP